MSKKKFLVLILKVSDKNTRIRSRSRSRSRSRIRSRIRILIRIKIRIRLVRGTDPLIRIRSKMSRIREAPFFPLYLAHFYSTL
jgi:hypothetical protein